MSVNKINSQFALAGKNREDVAKILGINRATLYRKLSGKTEFTLNEIKTLATALHIQNISDVFFDM